MLTHDFYQTHLNRVSRSFAFCISHLKTPLKAWVGLTYLICRILDTVEDAPWQKTTDQMKQFEEFDQFLKSLPNKEILQNWRDQFPLEIPDGEKQLIEDSHIIFADLHRSPESIKGIISNMVLSMSRGMKHFSDKKRNEKGHLKLVNLREVNQYCFFVAGVVGEALARLVAQIEPQLKVAKNLLLDAHHFGLFLQKVNLLKDQLDDYQEGREFIFDREQIYQSMNYNAYGAFRFLSSVPEKQREFRLFCAWSLFLGLASLPWLEILNKHETTGKLPRKEAETIFSSVEKIIDDSSQLEVMFLSLMQAAHLKVISEEEYMTGSPSSEPSDWLRDLYFGEIEFTQLASLGM
ncbi:MAG: squalene/phytoene synthase family protein [Bdellovibrionales bacterium]|nr:squalene/phytoene synthase family protein [Bdellovibrionales bacterium]